MPTLSIEAGDRTEALLQFITKHLDNASLDEIEIDRTLGDTAGLASEPLTVVATVTLSVAAISAIVRLMERYLENEKELEALRIFADGFTKSDAAGRELADLAKNNNKVSISYGIVKESWKQR